MDGPDPRHRPRRRRALFLDRDGVINVDHGYVHRVEQFEFCPGIVELIAHANARGWAVVVVTNQSGIARGYYGEADFEALTAWMQAELARRGATVDRVYHCPCHPEQGVGAYRRESPLRKPNPGMLLQAAAELGLDLAASVIVGDSESDIEAGRRAGLGRLILVDWSGRAHPDTGADLVVDNLDAVRIGLDRP
ncbi:MAG: HAD family hydrolase [Burkholderiales bacterium]|nr:HAD family hydrolase [Burkholderiales bacterium]MDE1929661.1 HAD family hydrolase [Burkholderiales bacterium]MDE2158779.1 HAD family hydrolase [Burkholderiales bacterium]MDE2502381.1 HAD family hydrolase [Burkholderiales bacterium]